MSAIIGDACIHCTESILGGNGWFCKLNEKTIMNIFQPIPIDCPGIRNLISLTESSNPYKNILIAQALMCLSSEAKKVILCMFSFSPEKYFRGIVKRKNRKDIKCSNCKCKIYKGVGYYQFDVNYRTKLCENCKDLLDEKFTYSKQNLKRRIRVNFGISYKETNNILKELKEFANMLEDDFETMNCIRIGGVSLSF